MSPLDPALWTLPDGTRLETVSLFTNAGGRPVEVRKFQGGLQAAVDAAIAAADIPPGHNGVALELGAGTEEGTVSAVIAVRAGDNWSIATGFVADLRGNWAGKIRVRKSF